MKDLGIECRPITLFVPDLDYKNNPELGHMMLNANPSKTLNDYGIVPGETSIIFAEWRY